MTGIQTRHLYSHRESGKYTVSFDRSAFYIFIMKNRPNQPFAHPYWKMETIYAIVSMSYSSSTTCSAGNYKLFFYIFALKTSFCLNFFAFQKSSNSKIYRFLLFSEVFFYTMDDFAKFMSEINSDPPNAVPKKRGLPAAYANRHGMYESHDAKTRRIEKEADKVSGVTVDNNLVNATISAAPVRTP